MAASPPPRQPAVDLGIFQANDGDLLESPSLSLARDDDDQEQAQLSLLGEIDADSSDEEVSYPTQACLVSMALP